MVNWKRQQKGKRIKARRYKRKNKMPIPSGLRPACYSCILHGQDNFLQPDTLLNTPFTKFFSLDDCPTYVDYQNMFDGYRINKVVVHFIPVRTQQTNLTISNSTTAITDPLNVIPKIAVAIDRDDVDFSRTTYANVRDKYGSIEKDATEKFSIALTPTRLMSCYINPIATGYVRDDNIKSFCDSTYQSIPHYGLKANITSHPREGAYRYRIETKYYMSFTDKRK